MAYQFETVKLDKGMYSEAGSSFTKVLEKCDPSEQYKGTSLEGLDAFQRQLKRFDIKVKGAESDVVSKFFATWESAVLFPEYVARAVRQGMEENDILPFMTAAETTINGMDYRSIASEPSDEGKSLKMVAEGAEIPQTRISSQENLVKLHKRGRMLVASYEAIQFQRLDLFSVTLRQIGAYINRMHVADAIDVITKGDGNSNAAQVFTIGDGSISGTAGTLSYDALVDFWSQFDPYTMNTLLVGDAMAQVLKLPELRDAPAGLTFQGTGKMVTPMGATLLRSSAVPSNTILGLDKNYALELVRTGEVLVEYDKLIDRQLERAAVTSISGFSKIFQEASKVLSWALVVDMTEEIMTVVQGLVDRELQPGELAVLEVLCGAAEERWRDRLRDGVQVEDFQGIFALACAWSALAALEETMGAVQPLPRSFTAGELRVEADGDVSASARSLRRQAEVLMEPYVCDERFAFLEVVG